MEISVRVALRLYNATVAIFGSEFQDRFKQFPSEFQMKPVSKSVPDDESMSCQTRKK
jgi:hypothetical protein